MCLAVVVAHAVPAAVRPIVRDLTKASRSVARASATSVPHDWSEKLKVEMAKANIAGGPAARGQRGGGSAVEEGHGR